MTVRPGPLALVACLLAAPAAPAAPVARAHSPAGVASSAAAHVALGRAELADGRTHGAVAAFERAIALEPAEADHHFQLGLALCDHVHVVGLLDKMGVARRLRRSFEEAVRLDAAHVGARIALIEFHRQAPEIVGGDRDEARRHAEELLALRPVEGRLALARMLWKYDERRAAERHVRQVLGVEPGHRGARFELAVMMVDIGRHEEAQVILRSLLIADPDDLAAAFHYGRALALAGQQLDQAERSLRRVAEAAPSGHDERCTTAHALWLLASVYEQRGETERADVERRRALEIDPTLRQRDDA